MMKKITQLDVLEALTTVFEERLLDDNCAKNNLQWDVYIRRILDGWTPDNFHHEHWLDCYRLAVKKLGKAGRTTTGVSLAEK